MGWCRRRSVNSASQSILSKHGGGGTLSATGKTKVGRNANFVLIRKVRFSYEEAQAPSCQRLALRNMTNIEPAEKTASMGR